jgi:hypothetical protein
MFGFASAPMFGDFSSLLTAGEALVHLARSLFSCVPDTLKVEQPRLRFLAVDHCYTELQLALAQHQLCHPDIFPHSPHSTRQWPVHISSVHLHRHHLNSRSVQHRSTQHARVYQHGRYYFSAMAARALSAGDISILNSFEETPDVDSEIDPCFASTIPSPLATFCQPVSDFECFRDRMDVTHSMHLLRLLCDRYQSRCLDIASESVSAKSGRLSIVSATAIDGCHVKISLPDDIPLAQRHFRAVYSRLESSVTAAGIEFSQNRLAFDALIELRKHAAEMFENVSLSDFFQTVLHDSASKYMAEQNALLAHIQLQTIQADGSLRSIAIQRAIAPRFVSEWPSQTPFHPPPNQALQMAMSGYGQPSSMTHSVTEYSNFNQHSTIIQQSTHVQYQIPMSQIMVQFAQMPPPVARELPFHSMPPRLNFPTIPFQKMPNAFTAENSHMTMHNLHLSASPARPDFRSANQMLERPPLALVPNWPHQQGLVGPLSAIPLSTSMSQDESIRLSKLPYPVTVATVVSDPISRTHVRKSSTNQTHQAGHSHRTVVAQPPAQQSGVLDSRIHPTIAAHQQIPSAATKSHTLTNSELTIGGPAVPESRPKLDWNDATFDDPRVIDALSRSAKARLHEISPQICGKLPQFETNTISSTGSTTLNCCKITMPTMEDQIFTATKMGKKLNSENAACALVIRAVVGKMSSYAPSVQVGIQKALNRISDLVFTVVQPAPSAQTSVPSSTTKTTSVSPVKLTGSAYGAAIEALPFEFTRRVVVSSPVPWQPDATVEKLLNRAIAVSQHQHAELRAIKTDISVI